MKAVAKFCYFSLFKLQISLIDRVHKIYNDTVWQDRSVSILRIDV